MRWLFVSVLLHLFISGYTQIPEAIKFTSYTRDNGLPEEYINNITQDSRGFIWIGSKEGLIRFDGLNFKTWYANSADSISFSNNNIKVLSEYKPGLLLFLSGNELWQINIHNQHIQRIKSLNHIHLFSTPQKLPGNRWCASDNGSIYVTDEKLNILYSVQLNKYYPAGTIVSLMTLHYPYLLVFTNTENKTYLLNYERKEMSSFNLENNGIDSRAKFYLPQVYDSTKKRLFLSAFFNGNFYCDLDLSANKNYTPIKITSLPDGAIFTSLLIDDDVLLQGGNGNIYLANTKKGITYDLKTKGSRLTGSNVILHIFRSKDDYFWLSTTSGIIRFTLKKPFINSIPLPIMPQYDNTVTVLLKAADGNEYYLEQFTGLHKIDKANNSVKLINSSLGFSWSAITNNEYIIATGGGKQVFSYNTITGKTSYPQEIKRFFNKTTDVVTLVFKSKNGDIWYSCNGGAGIIRNPAGTQNYFQYNRSSNPPAFSHSYVHAVAEDSKGNIWWGSNKTSSLLKWDAGKQQFEERPVGHLLSYKINKAGINNLFIDAGDNLWIALDGAALIKYSIQSGKAEYFNINKGLPSEAVSGMVCDAQNRLWFGTRKGLCCYLPDINKVITFTTDDGLPEDNFDGKGIYFDNTENLLYVAAKKTIAFFNPDTLLNKTTSALPPVYIHGIVVNGKPLYTDFTKKILLNPDENNIEFSFAAVDFNRNRQLEFQYRLKGISNAWIDLGEKRNITFNNLSSGDYNLSVRCKYKGNENWQETSFPILITIKTPWYKSNAFKIFAVLTITILVWLIFRFYYSQKLQKQKAAAEKKQAVEKERTRIATDMHDDFGANLSRIKFISEKMQLVQKDNEALKTDLSKISDYSDEMTEKMNEIVWALNQRYDSCADLVSFCRAYASEFLQDKNIRLVFSEGEIPDKKIQGETRRNIFLVMKEALHNIVKHSGATTAGISFGFDNGIQLTIADNGKGFNKEHIRPFANGLTNMKKRVEDIQGNLSIRSSNGTRIEMSIPI